jgi:predicted transcriptional regulator
MNARIIIEKLSEMGMTQVDIAARVGCSQSNVCLISTGKTKKTSIDIGLRLLKLAKEHGISVPCVEFLEKETREQPELEGR